MTGIPRSARARTVAAMGAPPSSFTPCAPVCCSTRPAFRIASSTVIW